jgi:hypothetical protein
MVVSDGMVMCYHNGKSVRPTLWKGGKGLYRCPICTMVWVKTLTGFISYTEWRRSQFEMGL